MLKRGNRNRKAHIAIAAGAMAVAAFLAPRGWAAAVGPSQPSSFAAQPQEQKEDYPDDGHWVWQKVELGPATPTVSQPEVADYWDALFPWILDGQATLTPSATQSDGNAEADVKNIGSLPWGFANPWSESGSAAASYNIRWTSVWVDPDEPATPDMVAQQSGDATASGGASMTVTSTAAADSGSSASGAAGASGGASCSTKVGGYAITLNYKEISNDAQYSNASNSLGVGGNIGGQVTDNSAGVKGSYSQSQQWAANGQGSASGTATYTLISSTAPIKGTAPVVVTEVGHATATGGGSGGSPGSESMVSHSDVNIADPPSGD
jgi:hypothetical protein